MFLSVGRRGWRRGLGLGLWFGRLRGGGSKGFAGHVLVGPFDLEQRVWRA